MSVTKNKQSKEDILHMVQKAFGDKYSLEDLKITELTEGLFNVAYEIELPEKTVILKVAPQPSVKTMSYEKNIMQAEVEGMRLVKKHTTVPIPEIYFYDKTKSISNAEYFFMEKLYGESFFKLKSKEMPQEEQNQILYKIGQLNYQMNQIKGSRFGYFGQPEKQGTSWKETFLDMISDVLKDGEEIEIGLGYEYDEIRSLILKAADSLDEVTQPVFVHWDLWDGNVFVKDGKIVGLIDFERALWGDPLMEFYFRDRSKANEFHNGYGSDLRSLAPVRALLYDIYLYLIMIIETKYRNYDNDWQINYATKELKISVDEFTKLMKTK